MAGEVLFIYVIDTFLIGLTTILFKKSKNSTTQTDVKFIGYTVKLCSFGAFLKHKQSWEDGSPDANVRLWILFQIIKSKHGYI